MVELIFHASKCDENETKPLVIIFGFFNSNKKIMEKFCKIWEGNNVFTFVSTLDFTTILMRKEIKKLVKKIHIFLKNNNNKSKTIYLHGISAGTCNISTFIRYLHTFKNGKFCYMLPMIKSIILDSGVVSDEKKVLAGFSKTLKQKGAIGHLVSLIFPIFKSKWRYHCQTDFPYLLRNEYCWNYLIISGEYDDFFPNASDSFVEMFKKSVQDPKRLIVQKKFNSKHALHFKNYPNEYKESINNFIVL
ncbi:hypothetical protein ACTA71_000684 [Dictyostelium dimigraforme]